MTGALVTSLLTVLVLPAFYMKVHQWVQRRHRTENAA